MVGDGSYEAKPIDTSGVVLPAELARLTTTLAENAHEVWAARRAAEGWSYGPQREDAAKRHPSLVPYDELPDDEREYDCALVTEVLKVLLAMGYRIERR